MKREHNRTEKNRVKRQVSSCILTAESSCPGRQHSFELWPVVFLTKIWAPGRKLGDRGLGSLAVVLEP